MTTMKELEKDDGTFDWYMQNGPSPKCHNEMQKRRAADSEKLKIKQRDQDLEVKEKGKLIELPSWSDKFRCVPNSVLRGSLFAAIPERNAKYVKNLLLHDTDSLKISYTGVRLTQTDLDVWEYVLHIAKDTNLGNEIKVNEAEALHVLGRKSCGTAYKWLRETLKKLSVNGVEITNGSHTYVGSLIQEYFKNEETGDYFIVINPRLCRLYNAGHTFVAWKDRKKIGYQKPLALWLHGYITSHSKWVPHNIETIRKYTF